MKAEFWDHYPAVGEEWIKELKLAVSDEHFGRFRQMDKIGCVTENRTEGTERWWRQAVAMAPWIEYHLPLLAGRDEIGSPLHLEAIDGYMLSPMTAHSVCNCAYIDAAFGTMDDWHVAEIGAGYGNFAMVVNTLFSPASYTIFDLPEASALQKKYLVNHVTFPALGEPDRDAYDFCFSWTSLCELSKAGREFYADRVLSRSKRGMHVGNFGDQKSALDYFAQSAQRKVFYFKDRAPYYSDNYIWGHKRDF